jgi:hypothetical protein
MFPTRTFAPSRCCPPPCAAYSSASVAFNLALIFACYFGDPPCRNMPSSRPGAHPSPPGRSFPQSKGPPGGDRCSIDRSGLARHSLARLAAGVPASQARAATPFGSARPSPESAVSSTGLHASRENGSSALHCPKARQPIPRPDNGPRTGSGKPGSMAGSKAR